jgi:hypothetical protein
MKNLTLKRFYSFIQVANVKAYQLEFKILIRDKRFGFCALEFAFFQDYADLLN